MKASPDCIVCVFWQALRTARLMTDNHELHKEVLSKVSAWIANAVLDTSPAVLSKPVYRIICEVIGNDDPFKTHKKRSNATALSLLPQLRELVAQSPNPLETALRISALGNLIDFGIGHDFNIEKDVKENINKDFAINVISEFEKELHPGCKLLYLGDNAGEIVMDMILVELLQKKGVQVTYTVKSAPIINDATMEDAKECGMISIARVITTGGDDIGINWNNVSQVFRDVFSSADVILAKGHGNFETCDERPENIYFLLRVKCHVVAKQLGVSEGNSVFVHRRMLNRQNQYNNQKK